MARCHFAGRSTLQEVQAPCPFTACRHLHLDASDFVPRCVPRVAPARSTCCYLTRAIGSIVHNVKLSPLPAGVSCSIGPRGVIYIDPRRRGRLSLSSHYARQDLLHTRYTCGRRPTVLTGISSARSFCEQIPAA